MHDRIKQRELANFIDVLASGRSPPEASFAELERSLDTIDPDALLKESGDQMTFNPTARQSSNPYYKQKAYLDSYLPSALEELRTIEQSTFNVFEDFGSDAVLLFDLSDLSSYAQCVLSDLLAWKLYCDMRATDQDIKNPRLSLVLNEPYSAGNPGFLPNQEPGPLSSVDWDMASKEGFVVDLCLGANPTRDLNMWQIHGFNTQIYQGDLNDFIQSDDVRPDDIPEDPFRDAMKKTTDNQYQVIVSYDTPGGSKTGGLITEPSFEGYAAGEYPPKYGAADRCLERFGRAAQEYLASEAPKAVHWSRRSGRPAAGEHVERTESNDWRCTVCNRHYWEYEDAVSCHDPGVFEKYRNCNLPIQFTLPPAILSRETTTGQSLDEAIAALHALNHQRPTDVVEALEVLEFVRVGGLPSYLRNGTEDLVEQICDALTPTQANEFTELTMTRSLSRRTYHIPTEEGRSRLTVSARVPGVRVVDSSIRHNGILNDTVRLLSSYDDVAWVAAPYYGLPGNEADIVAFNDDWSIQYLAEIVSADDEEIDQEPVKFNSLVGGTHHLYVCQNSDLVRQLINAYTNDTVPDRRFSASKPITGDYYIGDLRKRFLEIDHDELHPITTHRVVEDDLKETASSPQSQ
ncbi:hypothetical protein [Halomicrobium katesii]|uniref:hypothetical protein n=1 Tax=Halomicrobium katesii TaxID=437163 RepID=UPI00036A696A|nr:hypothetical protein [Halomicrobium katesii]